MSSYNYCGHKLCKELCLYVYIAYSTVICELYAIFFVCKVAKIHNEHMAGLT